MKIIHQDLFVENLSSQLKETLPGLSAHNLMAHKVRQRRMSPPDNVRIACVLALLYPKQDEWHTVLMERVSTTVQDKHKGQISFPGGKLETSDDSYEAAALREAEEEVNVDPNQVQVLGRLSELYIPVSNFLVHPFVGISETIPHFKPDPSEVANIIEMPISHFLNHKNIKKTDIKITPKMTLREVPYYDLNGQVLWGATAMMMSELITVVNKIR